jgi:hypothetical protein
MPCNPNDNQINVDIPPPPTVPGFGIPLSPIQIPLPNFELPTDLIEDFLSLLQKLSALFPSGTFNAFPDINITGFLGFVSDVLRQIAPFLSLYNFFLAILRLLKCIIDVLCAIPNPFAVASKLIVLFTECLPPFLNLFPIFALIDMIIALLLLILAIIQFIIDTILAIIIEILKNLAIFVDAAELQDAQSILAVVQKIANVLCYLQNILAALVALAAIINIIKSLASFGGVTFCQSEEEDGCCPLVLCPPFIKNTPDGISTNQGKLIYISQIGLDSATLFGDLGMDPAMAALISIPPIRKQRWQVFDKNIDAIYKISNIITPVIPVLGDDFWAEEVLMTKDTSSKKAQYTVDLKLKVNPAQFGITDFGGERFFKIKDCIVVERPYIGAYRYNSEEDSIGTRDLTQGTFGVLSIAGGKVYELLEDGTEVEYFGGAPEQRTLNTFIAVLDPLTGLPPVVSSPPPPGVDDSISFDNIEFTWKPNAAALAGYNVTTFGCIPTVAIERDIVNSVIIAEGLEPVIDKLPELPDVEGAHRCVISALEVFRKNISPTTASEFQAAALSCMNKLRDDVISTITAAVKLGASAFKSDYQLDTDLQFTGRNIKVSVFLKDPAGTLLTTNLPIECSTEIASNIKSEITLGEITSFEYDGYSTFVADLTSQIPGDGQITVLFNDKVISEFIPGSNGNPSLIRENVKTYTFVDVNASVPVRRDETDVE